MSATETSTAAAGPMPGLRERKKVKTRQNIRRAAYRLFAEQGYPATTVERIAEAADVSPSTFFRYFPTKEDVVIHDEYEAMLVAALGGRPSDEPVVDAIRHTLTESLARLLETDRDELLFRMRLGFTVPAVRARCSDERQRSQDAIAAVIVERTGRAADDLAAHCAAAAIIAVFTAVLRHWVERGGVQDVVGLCDGQLALFACGLRL
ncbi:acyl-CoA-like ligand-binding transcription factor [Streptomyces sp. NBC_00344]|uniref:acyl-CoA-like ligand-binding transcription factor n=1 Tax=Streptomyces sp. NBC_00344 TaxID=2975720 RepID=UPI002E2462F0